MNNEGKLPHFTELVWESTESNVPIPPREAAGNVQPQSAAAKMKKKEPPKETVQLQLWDMEEKQEPQNYYGKPICTPGT